MNILALWLLLLGSLVHQGRCQHWSYGLSPGGKRELDNLSDTLGNVSICKLYLIMQYLFVLYIFDGMFFVSLKIVEGFSHPDKPCGVLGCAEVSPFDNMYRMNSVSFASFVFLWYNSVLDY